MSGNDLGMDVYKMNRRFQIKSKETRVSNESLRSPHTYPNFGLKNSELRGGACGLYNKNVFCEQTKQFFTSRENSLGDPSSNCKTGVLNNFNKEEFGSRMSGRTLTGKSVEGISGRSSLQLTPAKEENASSNSDFSHAKQKKIQNSSENTLSVSYDSKLFNSLMPSPRMNTCHHCGLHGDLRCSQCKQTYYCSTECQKKDWSAHSIVCKPIKQNLKNSEDNAKLPGEIKNKIDFKGSLSLADVHKIEDGTKRVMLADLQSLGLKKAMEIQGTVTEFRNPSEFYIQVYSPEVLERIRKLTLKLKDCYANNGNQEEYIPIKGEVCVAKYSLDQTWNRVLVKKVDISQKKAEVLYIDYGNGENASLYRIKPLQRDIDLFPPCAIKCCVANVPKQASWNKDGASIFTPLLMGQYCSVTVVDLLQEEMMTCFAVDVVLPGSGKHLDKLLLEMGNDLSPKRKETKNTSLDTGTMLEKASEGEREKTAEDKRLVHSRDLTVKVVSMSVGDTFTGVVAHIITPDDFFCQQLHNGRQLAELQVSLSEYCNKIPSIPDFCPAVGDICCAQFTEDNQWYRASVLAYTSQDTALVGYTDYGNFEVLQVARLRPMIPELLELPMQAIKCTLAGVKPLSGPWSSEAISLMKLLVQNKVITVKVVDKKETSSVVELTDESVTPVVNVSNQLLESGCAVKESKANLTVDETVKEESAVGGKINYTWVKLTLKQTLNIMLCVVNDPGEFFCHVLKDDDLLALNVLNKSLAEHCQKTSPNVSRPSKGDPCCAFFSGDGNWYRALVEDVSSPGAIKVQFVDYGNVEEVTPDKLRQISSTFLKLPFQGVKCWLSGVKPVSKEWLPEATARFHMCTAGIKLQARVVSLSENGAGIELIDNSMGCPRIISEILINEKLALKEVGYKGLPTKDGLPNVSVDQIKPQAILENSSEPWQTIELPINETVSVRVMEVIGPDLFYALPIETRVDQEKLHRLMIELAAYCNIQNSHTFRPTVGEACCAKSAGDGHWCRAIVLDVSQSEVKVAHADYGNIEILPFSRVLPIAARFLKLPFQIIKCSLAGIVEWSPLIVDLLKTLILNKCAMITVRGISENIHSVSVEKCFENSNLSIADKLVMESLAKYNNPGNQSILQQAHGNKANCCCIELKKQIEKHQQILLFLLNKQVDQDKCGEMKKLLEH